MWGSGSNSPWGNNGSNNDRDAASLLANDGSQEGQQGFSLSQESVGFSQYSQYSSSGGALSLSQLSQSQPETPTCTECQSMEFETTDMGDMVCCTCGTLFEGNVNEQAEDEETAMLSQGMRQRSIRKEKVFGSGKKPSRVFSNTRDCMQAFQLALIQNVQAFTRAANLSEEASTEVKRLAADLWFSYLERLTVPTAAGDGGIRIRDDFRSSSEALRMKMAEAGTTRKRKKPVAATIDDDDVDIDDPVPTKPPLKRGAVARDRADSEKGPGAGKGGATGVGGGGAATVIGHDALSGIIPPVCMMLIPAILYLCARWLRSPLVSLDIVRWIRAGTLPYMACFTYLPASIQAGLGSAIPFFMPREVPGAAQVSILADRLAALLGLQLPPLNTPMVAQRFAEALGMPPPVLNSVAQLAGIGVVGMFRRFASVSTSPKVATSAEAASSTVGSRKSSLTSGLASDGGAGDDGDNDDNDDDGGDDDDDANKKKKQEWK